MKEAFEDKQYARISRELARLHYNNIDPLIAFKKAILWSYNKLEDGTTHSYAAGADWLKLYLQSESLENKIIYLTEAIEYMSFDSLRHNTYAYSENIKEWDYEQFIKAVESQNENTAIELINGAFLEGLHFNDIEKALVHIALDHYNDFGHSLIYTQKTAYLIEKLGTDVEKELTQSLIRSIIKATREDLLPEFKKYNLYLNQVGEKSKENDFFLKNVEHSMKLTNDLLQLNSPKEVYELLLTANAKNLLYFDLSYQDSTESKVSENIGWLDFTHAITFSNAVNQLCNKYPQFWRSGLIQMSCFNGRNVSYLDLNIKTDIYEFSDYINFKNQVMEKILDHGIPTPIFPAHILKTAIAIFNEYEKTANLELKKYLGISLNRFLQSPIKQKHAKRTIKQSLKLVSRDFK